MIKIDSLPLRLRKRDKISERKIPLQTALDVYYTIG